MRLPWVARKHTAYIDKFSFLHPVYLKTAYASDQFCVLGSAIDVGG